MSTAETPSDLENKLAAGKGNARTCRAERAEAGG